MSKILKNSIIASICVLLISSVAVFSMASAEGLPPWIKNTALWYGDGSISETEFLNAIKFLLENKIIILENETEEEIIFEYVEPRVIIPNGNFDVANTGFYIPLNLEVRAGTTVTWVNEDSVPHTIQSQDEKGNIVALFNSAPLLTGETFLHTFDESGVYNYYCSLHPWRVGIITVR